ncbi:hypothetical protein Lal_00033768 [Lupinus albus]|nr:hypothetical protein Lal_00033768 [Lupinus albus]
MTRDNLYWLSHDQVALFKTFHGTALMCKQTINHTVPRIKQLNSLIVLEYTKKYGFQCQFRNTHNIGFPCEFYSNKLTTSVSILNFPQYWIPVPTLVPQKEREIKRPELHRHKF